MSNRDYVLLSAVIRLRAALKLLRDAKPQAALRGLRDRWTAALMEIEVMIDEIDREIQKAREEHGEPGQGDEADGGG